MLESLDILNKLYNEESKHSYYQILPNRLSRITGIKNLNIKSRYEYQRLEYIKQKIQIKGMRILDIGGNTGFFSFEMIEQEAESVDYFEGNEAHAEFVSFASSILEVDDKINIVNKFYSFELEKIERKYDLVLLLNVLHHLGEDYGNEKICIDDAKKRITDQINSLQNKTDFLVLQLGFNWKGDIKTCLFENGLKSEMISYLKKGTKEYWNIVAVGIAERLDSGVVYKDLNERNIVRDDLLGEFLNRPLFILKSKRYEENDHE